MKQVKIQTHYITNRDFRFLRGFIIPFKSVFMQFSIQGTHGSFKEELTNWETLDFSLSKTIHQNEKFFHLQLNNWSNCSYFKICVAGPAINVFEIFPELVITKKNKEINKPRPPIQTTKCLQWHVLHRILIGENAIFLLWLR